MGAANVTLFAQWTTIPTYTVLYRSNGSTGGAVPVDNNDYIAGASVTVLGNTGSLVKTGNTFAGWNTKANGTGTTYAAGVSLAMGTATVTLYALWTTNATYSVTYNGNGYTGGTMPTDNNNYLAGASVTVRATQALLSSLDTRSWAGTRQPTAPALPMRETQHSPWEAPTWCCTRSGPQARPTP